MNHELRFGILTLQHLPWEEEVKRWRYIESLGFDHVWVADHFVNFANPHAYWFEAWTHLAALAVVTKQIRIGTLVSSLPLRNPAMLARQALTVDHISQGRLELGLGSGVSGKIDIGYAMIGVTDWSLPERIARFREMVEIVDLCLRNHEVDYEGRYYHLKGTIIAPAPIQKPRPPFTIAAMGSKMLKIAAMYGDTWNSTGGYFDKTPDQRFNYTKKRNTLLDKYCIEIDRDPKTIRRSLLCLPPEASTIFDSVEFFQKYVKRYYDIGITEFIFYYPFKEDQIPNFERIARNVIPRLRQHLT
jgi:alkanesulfonate monooxygenase SsuD/methylene tetrahydromethanopterin reductase-like flavin-dependent oxidoreductase (luciferase family)